jgi:drug/metabolite transporter (DMT)-like permease
MINAINPLLTALMAVIFLGEKLTPRKIFFILTAFLGVVLTLSNWSLQRILSFDLNVGDLLMLCGAMMWATYGIIVKRIMPFFTPLKLTTYTFLFSAIMLLPFTAKELIALDYAEIGWMPFMAVLYMAIFPSVIGYTIQQTAIKELGAGKTALFINLVPVISTIFAIIFLGEKLFKLNVLSGAIIIVSVILFRKQKV